LKKILFVLLLLSFQASFACLNGDSYLLKNGQYLYQDYESNIPSGHHFFTSEYEDHIHELDSLYQVKQNIDFLSDKGLILILQKKYQEAIDLYLDIEKKNPNRYSTASNMGTAYELIGDNENALKWIKKAVEINPKSHFGSEWIHVAILEAKIKGEAWINADSLMKMNFGNERKPLSNLSQDELTALSQALYYQLKERMSFISPKDPIVAQLLFELGNVYYLKGQFNDALGTYQQAKKYGFQSQLIDQRLSSLTWKPKIVTKFIFWPYVVGGILSLLLIGFFLFRRRMKNLAKNS
jgi:hypothetical protein